jgi:hypothetical protein
MRARRGNVLKPWQSGFWISLIYDALSDYGWSTTRPLLIWLISIVAFAVAYLANAGRLARLRMRFPLSCVRPQAPGRARPGRTA